MAVPLINGVAHSWANVTVTILGQPIIGISAVSYEDSREKENNFGAGGMPVSRGVGNYTAKASITLYAEESQKLADVAPEGDITLIPIFDVLVTFLDATGTILTIHIIKNCEFMGNKREVKQGDKKIEVQHDLIVSHILWKN